MPIAVSIVDLVNHRMAAKARGWSVTPRLGRFVLSNPYGDYRGTFDTEDAAWTQAPAPRKRAA